MTLTLVAVALVALTVALLAEDWSWKRKHPTPPVLPPVRGRCLCCDPPVHVEDIFTHSHLAHRPRERAAEDHPEWSNQ